MKRKLFFLGAMLWYIQVGFAQSAAEQLVLQLCKNKFEYMLGKDTVALARNLHPQLQYIHSSGKIDTKKSLIATITKGTTLYKKLAVYDEQLRTIANTIIVTAKLHYAAESKGEYREYDLLFTEVYIKLKQNWYLIQRHATKL
jgi:hypothetical protein